MSKIIDTPYFGNHRGTPYRVWYQDGVYRFYIPYWGCSQRADYMDAILAAGFRIEEMLDLV